ncbi:MAG TPA: hypothetical protein VNL94_04175 [Candidatus Binatia bacterium]|nr:hypothetical protein [Candidatus Binatia bacterium]
MIGPAPILAAIVGLFHVSAYVFIRGRAGARLPFLLLGAVLGAWAGDAVGARLGIDPLRVGEFNLLFASLMAWLAIGLVATLAILLPERTEPREREVVTTTVTRPGPPSEANAEPQAPA